MATKTKNEVNAIANTATNSAVTVEAIQDLQQPTQSQETKEIAKKVRDILQGEDPTAIKYAYESRLSLGSLYLSIACKPDKNGNATIAYSLEVNNDGLYDLKSYKLNADSIQNGKLIATFDFSVSQCLVLDTIKTRPEELDRVLISLYNSYRGDKVRTNCDYWVLYLLSVMSIADVDTHDGITSYKEVTEEQYLKALASFSLTFESLADRVPLIKARLKELKAIKSNR